MASAATALAIPVSVATFHKIHPRVIRVVIDAMLANASGHHMTATRSLDGANAPQSELPHAASVLIPKRKLFQVCPKDDLEKNIRGVFGTADKPTPRSKLPPKEICDIIRTGFYYFRAPPVRLIEAASPTSVRIRAMVPGEDDPECYPAQNSVVAPTVSLAFSCVNGALYLTPQLEDVLVVYRANAIDPRFHQAAFGARGGGREVAMSDDLIPSVLGRRTVREPCDDDLDPESRDAKRAASTTSPTAASSAAAAAAAAAASPTRAPEAHPDPAVKYTVTGDAIHFDIPVDEF